MQSRRPGCQRQLKERYSVSAGTANRAAAELTSLGLVTASRGRRALVSGRRAACTWCGRDSKRCG
ncbi:GntR family transcriptional regulator [Pseudonocardia sp. K10HN5]|uniref:GntR family transcriptional regulator n=1 Tax=Pseudonocardia acidicola TaxID=2724939 RepID=A0ABX1SCB4_9PSEU|nr:GntR family transcriptional regulator [Pseudonocardia acidicola]